MDLDFSTQTASEELDSGDRTVELGPSEGSKDEEEEEEEMPMEAAAATPAPVAATSASAALAPEAAMANIFFFR